MKIIELRRGDTFECDGPAKWVVLEERGHALKIGVEAPATTRYKFTKKVKESACQSPVVAAQ